MKKICLLTGLILSLAAYSFGQGSERLIDFPPNQPENPVNKVENGRLIPTEMQAVALIGISVEGKPITPGKAFAAGDDWLKTLTVKLKNVSDKPISSVRINFGRPEAKTGDSTLGFSLAFGSLNTTFDKQSAERIIEPGEEFELSKPEKQYLQEKAFLLEKTGISVITKVTLDITTIKFQDGETWTSRKLSPVK